MPMVEGLVFKKAKPEIKPYKNTRNQAQREITKSKGKFDQLVRKTLKYTIFGDQFKFNSLFYLIGAFPSCNDLHKLERYDCTSIHIHCI
jgi:hypothetical protein